MVLLKWHPSPEWMTVLAVDALYFHAAKSALVRAAGATKAIDKAERRVARLQAKMDALDARRAEDEIDDSTHYDRFEPMAIQMDGAEYEVGAAYGPFLQELAAVHLFAAAALEAHINIRGQDLLKGRFWRMFERLPIDAKWLLLPRLQGATGFDPGAEPFQGFDRLIRIRNSLAHYQVRKEPWHGSAAPPEFLSDLGLSSKQAEQSLNSVRGMARALAIQLGLEPPSWLDAEECSFFEIEDVPTKVTEPPA